MMFRFIALILCCAPLAVFAPNLANAAQKAILLLEHGENSPWHELLKQGFEHGARDFGFDTEIVIAPADAGQREAFRNAAARANLVIVASDNLHEALRDNAANYRRVKFGSVDAGIRAANIMSVTFADEQAAFLAGAAAAMLAKMDQPQGAAGIVGWLSGMDTPAMRTLFNGFSEGAALGNPQGRVIQAVVGSFTAPALAAQKAQWLASSGASVIALGAGAGNKGINGAFIPLELDKNSGAGLGAIVKAADRAVYEIMASAAGGKFRGKEILVYDLANKGVDFIPNEKFLAGIRGGADIGRRVRELRGELAKGAIRIASLRQRTLCDCLD